MNAIRIHRTLTRPVAEFPELDAVVGEPIEVIVLSNRAVDPSPSTADGQHPRKRAGFARGRIRLADDFDAPLDDFKDYM